MTEMVIVEGRLWGGGGVSFLHYQCQSFQFLNWFLFVSIGSFESMTFSKCLLNNAKIEH